MSQVRQKGEGLVSKSSLDERFWAKVDRSGDCWIWTAATNGRYGVIGGRRSRFYAHRLSVLLDGREIPEGMQIDHLCRNTLCVNPKHLDVVTPKENWRRIPREGLPCVRRSRTRTHCSKGHELSPENVFYKKGETFRRCRACHRIQTARFRLKLKQGTNHDGAC